jgi:hypothetical protein
MKQKIPDNMFVVTHCCLDKTELEINDIDTHPDGHVYMICPKCGWEMSVRHRNYPNIDNMLGATEKYINKLIFGMR